jgi:hypothetical protein
MAKRSPATRSGRGDGAFVRVSGQIADFLGFKSSAGRYIARETLEPLEAAAQAWERTRDAVGDAIQVGENAARSARDKFRAQTVSNRQRATESLRNRTGEREITRERYTREVKTGERRYASEKTVERQRHAEIGKEIRKEIPDVEPDDAAIMLKWRANGGRDGGHDALNEDEQEAFDGLFKKYPAEKVRKVLGSPKRERSHRRHPDRRRDPMGTPQGFRTRRVVANPRQTRTKGHG